jgi:hypothetical protein
VTGSCSVLNGHGIGFSRIAGVAVVGKVNAAIKKIALILWINVHRNAVLS